MADVFISHHEESAGPLAAQIADELERVGISCWYAPRNMGPGEFPEQIYNAICDCRVFILIVNPQIAQAPEVWAECRLAYNFYKENPKRVLIVPFLVDNCPLPLNKLYYLQDFHYIDSSIPALVDKITKELKQEPQTPPAPPVNILDSGKCGDDVSYKLNENGVLTIFGNGPMKDFESDNDRENYGARWWDKRPLISHVEIQEGVTCIGASAFEDCTGLISVKISDSVTKIGNGAFSRCERLTSVTIPNHVIDIGAYAFWGCVELTSVTISDSVTKIGAYAFWGCVKLPSVSISSVASIGKRAFAHCEGLTSVDIPNVTEIGWYAFSCCAQLSSFRIPDSITEIGWGVFSDCTGLTSVIIPDNVAQIGKWAFYGCAGLTSVSIPSKAHIFDDAFPDWIHKECRE